MTVKPLPPRPGLQAAVLFDASCAVDRARAELIDALKLLDGEGHSAVHGLRNVVTAVDDVRSEIRGRSPERELLDWLHETEAS